MLGTNLRLILGGLISIAITSALYRPGGKTLSYKCEAPCCAATPACSRGGSERALGTCLSQIPASCSVKVRSTFLFSEGSELCVRKARISIDFSNLFDLTTARTAGNGDMTRALLLSDLIIHHVTITGSADFPITHERGFLPGDVAHSELPPISRENYATFPYVVDRSALALAASCRSSDARSEAEAHADRNEPFAYLDKFGTTMPDGFGSSDFPPEALTKWVLDQCVASENEEEKAWPGKLQFVYKPSRITWRSKASFDSGCDGGSMEGESEGEPEGESKWMPYMIRSFQTEWPYGNDLGFDFASPAALLIAAQHDSVDARKPVLVFDLVTTDGQDAQFLTFATRPFIRLVAEAPLHGLTPQPARRSLAGCVSECGPRETKSRGVCECV